jgi:hypothetical protein
MRIVGCTGVPADSHDVVWFQVAKEKTRRCPECGSGMLNSFCDYHVGQDLLTMKLFSVCSRLPWC